MSDTMEIPRVIILWEEELREASLLLQQLYDCQMELGKKEGDITDAEQQKLRTLTMGALRAAHVALVGLHGAPMAMLSRKAVIETGRWPSAPQP